MEVEFRIRYGSLLGEAHGYYLRRKMTFPKRRLKGTVGTDIIPDVGIVRSLCSRYGNRNR